jgi:hypothetical protein
MFVVHISWFINDTHKIKIITVSEKISDNLLHDTGQVKLAFLPSGIVPPVRPNEDTAGRRQNLFNPCLPAGRVL